MKGFLFTLQALDGPQLLVLLPVILLVLHTRKTSTIIFLWLSYLRARCTIPYPSIFVLFLFILIPLFLLLFFLSVKVKQRKNECSRSEVKPPLTSFPLPPNILDFLLAAASCQVVHSDSQEDVEQDVWSHKSRILLLLVFGGGFESDCELVSAKTNSKQKGYSCRRQREWQSKCTPPCWGRWALHKP